MKFLSRHYVVDFFGYLVFLLSSYVVFGTDLPFRFILIPVTLVAFYATLSNRYQDAFRKGAESAEEEFANVILADPDE